MAGLYGFVLNRTHKPQWSFLLPQRTTPRPARKATYRRAEGWPRRKGPLDAPMTKTDPSKDLPHYCNNRCVTLLFPHVAAYLAGRVRRAVPSHQNREKPSGSQWLPLSQAVSGSVGSQGAATNVSSLLSGLIGPGDRKSISADGGAAWVVRIRSTKMISFRTDWRPIGK